MRLRTKKRHKTERHNFHPTPLYVSIADDFDIMGLFAVRTYDSAQCPSEGWFRARAKLNGYLIAQHTVEGTRVVLRLK